MEFNPDCPHTTLTASGDLPEYLVGGTLYRTGPGDIGDREKDPVTIKHFFDGFTQNHRFHVTGIRSVDYSSRSSCDGLRKMYKEGSRDMERVTSFGPRDPCQTYFQKIKTVMSMACSGPDNVKTDARVGADMVNVGVTIRRNTKSEKMKYEDTREAGANHLGTKNSDAATDDTNTHYLTARTDSNIFQILDPMTLEPLEKYTYTKFDETLTGPLTASHVEFSADGLTEYNYNLTLGKKPEYVVFSKTDDKVTVLARFSAPGCYIHSFFTTENYIILALWQAEFWGGGIGVPLNKNVLDGLSDKWDPEKKTQFYVIKKESNSSNTYQIFQSQAFFAFHTINAFEEDGRIFLDVCTYENNRVLWDFKLEKFATDMKGVQANKAFVTRLAIDLTEEQDPSPIRTIHRFSEDLKNLELPTHNPKFVGKKARYVYGVNIQNLGLFLFEALIRIDMETGEALYFYEEGETPGEAIFVADPSSEDELGGVLLSISLNLHSKTSSLLVLDPRTMKVISRVKMETRVNYGFHGSWAGDLGA